MSITFDHQTLGQRVLFGSGAAIENSVTAVEGLGAKRVLLIADLFAQDLSDAIAAARRWYRESTTSFNTCRSRTPARRSPWLITASMP